MGTSRNSVAYTCVKPFWQISCLEQHVACICCMSAFFSHSKRKSWFRSVFYSILELWAPLEKVSFLDIFQFFLSWLACGLHLLRECLFLVIHNENLDFVLFFIAFLSRGYLSRRCFFETFPSRFLYILRLGEPVACMCSMSAFSGTQHENFHFVLFFIAFLSCGHRSKNCFC